MRRVLAVTLVSLAVGCAGGARVPAVVFAEPALRDQVRVGAARMLRVPQSGRLEVVMPLHNLSRRPLFLEAQAEFLDRRRAPYGDTTTRRILRVPGGGIGVFRATSRRQRAALAVVRLWRRPR